MEWRDPEREWLDSDKDIVIFKINEGLDSIETLLVAAGDCML